MSQSQSIEAQYQSRMSALSGAERVARSMAMLQWTREMLARQIIREKGTMSDEQLRWETSLRLYGAEPAIRSLIEHEIQDVSR